MEYLIEGRVSHECVVNFWLRQVCSVHWHSTQTRSRSTRLEIVIWLTEWLPSRLTEAPRLSFEKPNASASGSCNTVLQTPKPTSRALHLLQTPAPHIARQLAPLSPEPEVEEAEEEEPQLAYPDFDYNQEVEFAGASALEYSTRFRHLKLYISN